MLPLLAVSIFPVVLALVAVGVVLWLVNTYVPMAPMVKRLVNIVVIVVLVIWLMQVFGLWSELSSIRV